MQKARDNPGAASIVKDHARLILLGLGFEDESALVDQRLGELSSDSFAGFVILHELVVFEELPPFVS